MPTENMVYPFGKPISKGRRHRAVNNMAKVKMADVDSKTDIGKMPKD
jgi:hypothetical protein